MRFAEQETTTTIGELRIGDFITVVPTQERIRGVRFDSGIAEVTPQRFKRGRGLAAEIVDGSTIRTHRSPVRYSFPNHFTVKCRRQLED